MDVNGSGDVEHSGENTFSQWLDIGRSLGLPDAPAVLSSPGGCIIGATEQAAQLVGEPAAVLVGRTFADFAVRQGNVLRLLGPRGALVCWLSWPHQADERLHVTVMFDVSELVGGSAPPALVRPNESAEVEQVSRVSGSALQDVQRVARIGTWEWDPATDVIQLSTVAQELLRIPAERPLTLEDYLGYMLPEDRGTVRAALTRLAEQHEAVPVEYQFRLIRPDGALRTLGVHGTLHVQPDGTAVVAGTLQDIVDAEALHFRSGYDETTGLPDESVATDVLNQLLRGQYADRVAVLICAPDQIKRVGHSLGFLASNELHVSLAQRLREGLPENHTVVRGPGENQFTIICPDTTAAGGLEALTARAAGLLRTTVPVQGHMVQMSASIGMATPEQYGNITGEDMLRYAAVAVSEAQQGDVDQAVLADPELITAVDQQLPLEQQLREALHHDQLTLYYQPVVAADGAILRAEALVRWSHPHLGLLTPGAFLPVARRGGLMRELDQWVLRKALRDVVEWPSLRGVPVPVSINLAGFVPGDPEFVEAVADAVAASDIEWHRIVLELVETDLVDLRPHNERAMAELVERGIQFAIDDFGTGYSSLARLKDLPAQIIKLDRRFVTDIADDPADHAVSHAVCSMAHAMGRVCTAEGVETLEQLRVLKSLGLDHYQGFLFSRPVPEEEFRAVLTAGGYVPPLQES